MEHTSQHGAHEHTASESGVFQTALKKTLVIIGFCATIGLIIWLIVLIVERAPGAFSSLASLSETVDTHRPVNEITVATEKMVVNSNESFQISWTDMKQDGTYQFSYACVPGVSLTTRGAEGNLVPVRCSDTLSVPAHVHGLFLTITSDRTRFAEVPLKVVFVNPAETASLEAELKVTVVNATIPAKPDAAPVPVPTPPTTPTETPATPAPVPTPTTPAQPIVETGLPDLKVTIIGGGAYQNGVFTFTETLDNDARNGIRFDVRNVGTKTSGNWSFTAVLPNGQTYTSPLQSPLKPQDGTIMTLWFDLDRNATGPATASVTLIPGPDSNASNNGATKTVTIVN